MKRSSRQLIFFILLFLIFFLTMKTGNMWSRSENAASENAASEDTICIVVGMCFTVCIISIYYLAKLDKTHEKFWDVSPAARCKGGKYMWQGSSPEAVRCRALADTPQGREMISAYNCPKGFIGVPKAPFAYTALSDDNWQNNRTKDIQLSDTGSLATAESQN